MMRWDGTRLGIQAICEWANADDWQFEDPTVTYEFTGPADVQRVLVATDDGDFAELKPWGLILKTDNGYRVENPT